MKNTNGDVTLTCTTMFGKAGEAYNVHTDTDTDGPTTMTHLLLYEVNIDLAYTSLAALDIVGTQINLDAITAGQIQVFGIKFRYL